MAEPGITQTEVLKLNKPDKGYFDWDVPLNENWDKLDKLGAGQLPLMTPLDLTYKLSGAALLGWGLSGDYVDADIYTSLWDLCWAARQRAGEPVQSITVYGATYYVSRDSVTGMYFTTADSYTRAVTGCGSSLGMICEMDESTGTKTLRLPIDAWTRKPIVDYDAEGGYNLPGYFVPESLPNIKGSAYNNDGNAITSYYPNKTGSFYGIKNLGAIGWYSKPDSNNSDSVNFSLGFDASRSSSTYQDGAWVQPRAHASYRYYKIGNTIQNQGMIDVGALTSAVSDLETEVSRINTDMNPNILNASTVNWSAGVSIPLNTKWNVPSRGIVFANLYNTEYKRYLLCYVNDIHLATLQGSSYLGGGAFFSIVNNGNNVQFNSQGGIESVILRFYPFKKTS